MKTTIISSEDVVKVVGHIGLDRLMDEVTAGLIEACREYDQERYQVPLRAGFDYIRPAVGLLEWMPVMKSGSSVTFKMVGYHPGNPGIRNLPTILSTAMVFDTATGHMTGLVDATFTTAIRTGAASAVASSILASPDSRVLGLIGAGSQAVTQLHALSRMFEFDRVLVFDIDAKVSKSFGERVKVLNLGAIRIQPATLTEVLCSADILCTATSIAVGEGPVFKDAGLQPSVHVNAVGSDFPGKTELPLSLLERSLVCPDFLGQALKEGECQQLLNRDRLGPDLVTLIKESAEHESYRERPTVFDSTGWALEDHVAVDILLRYARELGYGSQVQIESISHDPHNPYGFVDGHASSAVLPPVGSKKLKVI